MRSATLTGLQRNSEERKYVRGIKRWKRERERGLENRRRTIKHQRRDKETPTSLTPKRSQNCLVFAAGRFIFYFFLSLFSLVSHFHVEIWIWQWTRAWRLNAWRRKGDRHIFLHLCELLVSKNKTEKHSPLSQENNFHFIWY